MFLGILTLITALSISAVAIYYSVAGLVAIFAAAAIPIIIMGSTLEIAKLVTAVWLHRYWKQAKWWLKTYLAISVFVLMFITSMGIFGFLSKAHIEQTASAQEGVAQLERIEAELDRQDAIITRAEERIVEAEASVGAGNDAVQAQIDREQARIDTAYDRIQPAIDEQNTIILTARNADTKRTEPYEQQLTALEEELRRLDAQAIQYEQRIAQLSIDTSSVDPVLAQIATIEESISLVQGQLAGGERAAIQAAQRTIGVDADGSAGRNTRRAADAWISTQKQRINQLQAQIVDIRTTAQLTVNAERTRLTMLVASIRNEQTQAIKDRQIEVLATIDQVRNTESPVIQSARNEISRIRAGADAQIAQSNTLIQSLRDSLTVGKDEQVEAVIAEQQAKIVETNNTIDTLTQQKYNLQAEYRKLEAEVGPVKYLAEFIYGETADQDLLEEAVRWVIIIIIFVFDPLAVLLLIASQYTFELRKQQLVKPSKKNKKERLRPKKTQYNKAQSIVDIDISKNYTNNTSLAEEEEKIDEYVSRVDNDGSDKNIIYPRTTEVRTQDRVSASNDIGAIEDGIALSRTGHEGRSIPTRMESEERLKLIEETEDDISWSVAKKLWKERHPDQSIKFYKNLYIQGKIDQLPWEKYIDNNEQN